MKHVVYHGDCIETIQEIADNFVDSIICDPPYGLEFMGNEWDAPHKARLRTRIDGRTNPKEGKSVTVTPEAYVAGTAYQEWCAEWAREALRVAKPGAFLLAFGGTRTYHRLASGLEDAGWDLRDCLMWVYGQGFPHSFDISKAFDRSAGVEREVIGVSSVTGARLKKSSIDDGNGYTAGRVFQNSVPVVKMITAPATEIARLWAGYGTALKPSYEPIIVAMKPCEGPYTDNALRYGVAGLNIDGCRIPSVTAIPINKLESWSGFGQLKNPNYKQEMNTKGRWPANLILDPEAGGLLDEQSGIRKAGSSVSGKEPSLPAKNVYGDYDRTSFEGHGDTGGASRFFYCAKVSKKERRDSGHPTMKPIALMRYLARLTKPPGGSIVLDPFCGSGSTGVACRLEGRAFIGIDQDASFVDLAKRRIEEAETYRDG